MSETVRVPARWLGCRERRPAAAYRLYCFPHSGGSAGEFVRWSDALPAAEVLGLQLPGRGARIAEPSFTRMDALVAAIVAAVPFRGPYAFFGHSLGALVAFEVARALRDRGLRPPDRLFVSACPAPDLPRTDPPVHELPDAELAAVIHQEYGSLPPEITGDPDLLRLVLPAHRADFEIVETYAYRPAEPLDCPLTVVGGAADDLTEAELASWGRQTTAPLDLTLLPGDHFYLRAQRDRLLRLVSDRMAGAGPVPRARVPAPAGWPRSGPGPRA